MVKKIQHIDPRNANYDYDKRPLSASKMMMDLMLSKKSSDVKARDLLAVFLFYCYTGTWQKTWWPKCTVHYTAKALGMSAAAVRKAKAELIRLNLVEEYTRSVMKNGRNTIQYILHVRYFESQKDLEELKSLRKRNTTKDATVHNHEGNAYHTNRTNACLSNKINAYQTGSRLPHSRPASRASKTSRRQPMNDLPDFNDKDTLLNTTPDKQPSKLERLCIKWTDKLWNVVDGKRLLDPKSKKSKWRKEFYALVKEDRWTIQEVKEVLNWHIAHFHQPWLPDARSAAAFREKFDDIKAKMDLQNTSKDQPSQTPVTCPEAELSQDNLSSSGTECDFCGRSDRKVWYVLAPGSCDLKNICKKCHTIEEDKHSVGY